MKSFRSVQSAVTQSMLGALIATHPSLEPLSPLRIKGRRHYKYCARSRVYNMAFGGAGNPVTGIIMIKINKMSAKSHLFFLAMGSSGLAFIFKSSLSRPLLSGFGRFIWLKVVLNGRPVDIQMSMSVPNRFPDVQ